MCEEFVMITMLNLGQQLKFEQKTYVFLFPFLMVNLLMVNLLAIKFWQIAFGGVLALGIIALNQVKYRIWLAYLSYGYMALYIGYASGWVMLQLELFILLAFLLLYNDWILVMHNLIAGITHSLIMLTFFNPWQYIVTPMTHTLAFSGH